MARIDKEKLEGVIGQLGLSPELADQLRTANDRPVEDSVGDGPASQIRPDAEF